jgi:RND family efflux transporter MFP subunit
MMRSWRNAAALVLLPVLLAGCDEGSASLVEDAPSPPATVRVVEVAPAAAIDRRSFVGRVEALRTVDLAFQVEGELVALPPIEGETLERGALLAALDPEDFELALERAEAELQLASADYQRSRDLFARGAVPEARRDQDRAAFRLAEVARDRAARNLRLTRITAPFEALIARRLVDEHAYVTPDRPVLRVHDVTEMRVVISVPEDLVALVRSSGGFTAEARLTAAPEVAFPLSLREFAAEADGVAQSYDVSLAIDGPLDPRVLPGMTATVLVSVNGKAAEGVVEVPLAAIDTNGYDGFQVWVVDPQSLEVQPRPVTLGLPGDTTASVLAGLEQGEHIVAAGVARLSPGQRIAPSSF